MGKANIYYTRVDEFWTKEQKLQHLESIDSFKDIKCEPVEPDAKYNWLLEGLHSEYEDFIPLGTKEAKSTDGVAAYAIFKLYSRGAETARDEWAYNFNIQELSQNIQSFINFYNEQVYKWENERKDGDSVDSFVSYDETKIKWSSRLKECLESGVKVDFST